MASAKPQATHTQTIQQLPGIRKKISTSATLQNFPPLSVINPSFRVPSEPLYKTSVVIDPIKYMLFFQSYL
jgi:hypothetical protein